MPACDKIKLLEKGEIIWKKRELPAFQVCA